MHRLKQKAHRVPTHLTALLVVGVKLNVSGVDEFPRRGALQQAMLTAEDALTEAAASV